MLPRRHLIAALALTAAALFAMPGSAAGKVTAKRILFDSPVRMDADEIFSGGGLVLEATCSSGQELGVTVGTTVDGATLHANRQGPGSTDVIYGEIDGFDTADTTDLFTLLGGPDDGVAGQLVYGRPEGRYVTIDWVAFEDPLSSPDNCLFAGVAQVANRRRDRGSRKRVDYRADANADPKRVLDAGGLRLTATCAGGVPEVRARTEVANSTIHINSQSGLLGSYFEKDDLDPGDPTGLLSGLGVVDSGAGQIAFATPTGRTATLDFMVEQEDAFLRDCVFAGTARVAGRDSPGRVFFRKAQGDDNAGDPVIFRRFFDRGFYGLLGSCATDATQDIHDSSNQASSTGVPAQGAAGDAFGGGSSTAGSSGTLSLLTDDSVGQAVTAASNGAVASVDWLAESGGDAFGGGPDCLFAGTADVLKP